MSIELRQGDCLDEMRKMQPRSVHCAVTSPPYWGLRDYGIEGQYGLEESPEAYIARMVEVFGDSGLRRVLRDDGTLWLNLGDSYIGGGRGGGAENCKQRTNVGSLDAAPNARALGLKPKDLCGIPWRVALALQADGWYLRCDIIWSKPNPMPESVMDRPTKAHEYLFLLSKSPRYFYDGEAIKEPGSMESVLRLDRAVGEETKNTNGAPGQTPHSLHQPRLPKTDKQRGHSRRHDGFNARWDAMDKYEQCAAPVNKRSVWEIVPQTYKGAHFATFPEALVEPCIKAGTSQKGCCPSCGKSWRRVTKRTQLKRDRPNDYVKRNGESGTGNSCANSVAGVEVRTLGWKQDCKCPAAEPIPCTVLEPFAGSGTGLLVARKLGRAAIGIELNPAYVELAWKRINDYAPLFSDPAPAK